MKRLVSLALVFTLLLCLCACGNTNNKIADNSQAIVDGNKVEESTQQSIDTNTTDITQVEPSENQDTEFIFNTDLSVVTAFAYDGHTYIVVENVGEQPILNFKVAYIHFDKNGFVATNDSDGYEVGKYDTVNLMPGNKTIGSWYGADGDYVVATIIAVDYADGTTWEALQIDSWVETTRKEFSVDNYKSEISMLKELCTSAETNEYAIITNSSIKHGNRYSAKHDFHFSISNTSEQGITKLRNH